MLTHPPLLNPWNDFHHIQASLDSMEPLLIVALGASWCHKCAPLKDKFIDLAENDVSAAKWLWLDLDEHCEFLGNFSPETIPLIWIYQGKNLIRFGTPNIISTSIESICFIKTIPKLLNTHEKNIDIRHFLLN